MRHSRKAASAAFSAPVKDLSESSDYRALGWPTDASGNVPPAFVRVRRPDGSECVLKVPGEHLDRVLALAEGEFGDKSILGQE